MMSARAMKRRSNRARDGPHHCRPGGRSMRLMPKKSAKKVKAKKSKRPATTREVASLALSRKLTKAGKRVTKKAAKPAAKKPAKPVTKMAKPAAKKPAKPVAKMAKPVAKKAAKPLAQKAAVAKSSPRMDS